MMHTKIQRQSFGRKPHTSLLMFALMLGTGCIDVGHDAEIGCLRDMSEPGCRPGSGGGNSGGSSGVGGTTSTINNGGAWGNPNTSGGTGNVAASAGVAGTSTTDAGGPSGGTAGAGTEVL